MRREHYVRHWSLLWMVLDSESGVVTGTQLRKRRFKQTQWHWFLGRGLLRRRLVRRSPDEWEYRLTERGREQALKMRDYYSDRGQSV